MLSIKKFLQKNLPPYDHAIGYAQTLLFPLFLLVLRSFTAHIFLMSALEKIEDALKGDWYKVIFLYTTVHPVPLLSPAVAAILGTGSEIIFAVMLILGLGTRFASAGLVTVAIVATISIGYYPTHTFWFLLLGVTLFTGGGLYSIDAIIRKWVRDE